MFFIDILRLIQQTEKEKQAAKLSGKPEDDEEESNVHESAAAKKLKRQQLRRDANSANDGDESDDKSDIKRDPYAGMSRKQRRRRQMNDQETKVFRDTLSICKFKFIVGTFL